MNLDVVLGQFVGKIAWLPRRSLGTFVTIEFGAPMLMTREKLSRDGVPAALKRRRVTVQGEQHLWIQADSWTLQSETRPTASTDEPLLMSQRLEVLAGQVLTNVRAGRDGSEFTFEYGEQLRLQADGDPDQPQWSIFWHDGGSASWLNRGELRIDP